MKILKKCTECNIYPNLDTVDVIGGSNFLFKIRYICPKCFKQADSHEMLGSPYYLEENMARDMWNIKNGFEEDNPNTWTDEIDICYRYSTIDSLSKKEEEHYKSVISKCEHEYDNKSRNEYYNVKFCTKCHWPKYNIEWHKMLNAIESD